MIPGHALNLCWGWLRVIRNGRHRRLANDQSGNHRTTYNSISNCPHFMPPKFKPPEGLATAIFVPTMGTQLNTYRGVPILGIGIFPDAPRMGRLAPLSGRYRDINRQISTVGSPASCSLIIPIICASVKRLFLMTSAPSSGQTLHQNEGTFGGQVMPNRELWAQTGSSV